MCSAPGDSRHPLTWRRWSALADYSSGRHDSGVALTVGTSSGARQSAIVIPVPEAESLVADYRLEHDPVASAGVPAHITLIVPWVPPDEIVDGDLAELAKTLSEIEPFDFSLGRVCWFGRRVLWLGPDPVEPFIKLTGMLADRFGTPPYGDEFDEVVPHLTVAHATDGTSESVQVIAVRLASRLPVACRTKEAWVMVGDGSRWAVHSKFELG
jgi:2'-5' RNA ligase